MKNYDFEKVLQVIADEEGISVEEVREEMQRAVDAGLNNPSPAVQKEWENVPHEGISPTAKDLFEFITAKC